MKKLNKLFAILIAVLGVQTLSAQTWTAPVIGQDLKDVNDKTELYMYNVKADAFASSGMSWGTHAIVKELQNGDSKLSADVHRCRVSKPTDGQLQIMLNERQWLGGGGPSSTNDCWVDHGSNNKYIYNEVSDNVYTLKPTTATNESYLDCAWAYGGHITFSATNGYGNTEWAFVLRSDITNGKYLLYKAKKEMYDIYQALVEAGHDGTYADALATANAAYTASNATAATVNAATKVLLKAVAPALSSKYFAANSLFNNPDMRGYGDDTDWGNGLNAFGDGIFESWHSAETITQKQTGLPNGFYTVVFLGMYRQDDNKNEAAPTLTLTSGSNSAKANLKALTEIDFGKCSGNNGWTNANKPNDKYSAGEALAHTDAGVKVENFVVENGELTVTVAMPSGNQWLLCQGFQIYFKAESLDEYANLFYAAKSAAEAFGEGDLNAYAANQISTALSAAATEQVNKEWYQARTAELNAAVALANEVKVPYANFKSLITLCESTLTNSEEFEAGAEEAFTTAINTANSNAASATTADDINAAYNTAEEARRTYIQKADPLNGTLFDYTFMIVNPKLDEGTKGWAFNTGAPNNGIATNQGGAITGNYFENWKWESYKGEIYQELTGLPSGKYVLTIAAFRDQLIEGAADGDAVYVFANDEETLVSGATPAFYSVEVSIATGTLRFGVKSKMEKYRWMGIDNASLSYKGFDVETAKNGITNLVSQAEALAAEPMNKEVLATLNQTIGEAENVLDAANPTRKELNEMVETLNQTIENTKVSVAEYKSIAAYIAKADGINESIASDYKTQHANGTISESLETISQKLEVATYNYVTENFTYAVPLSDTWNSTGTNTSAADVKGEHWSDDKEYTYKNQFDGWGDPKQGYPAGSWTIDFDQEVKLPAGEYVFKVAGRKSIDATLELVVTMGETELGTVNDFPSSNEALGINKAGATSFDANDPAGFAKEGKGYGWQWRYVRFVLDEEATVKVAVHAETNKIYNWVSFGDYTLQMTEETYLEANKDIINTAVAAAEALVNTLPMGDAEKEALQTALDMTYKTGAEMLEKTEALNTAVANAKAWVAAYNEAKVPLVAALERFEEDFNDAQNGALAYMNKNIWSTVIEKVQAAAVAKDAPNSYAGFEAATTNLVNALNEAQASITAYAGLKAEINYTEGYTPIKSDNIDALAADRQEANSGYNDATITTDRANALIASLQSYRVQDYAYAKENFTEEVEIGVWEGKTATNKGEHWNGNAEATYFDYSRWGEAGVHEATQTITLPAGEYVLMAAGRASDVEGTEAYIKVNDTKANFAIKGSYGHGIAKGGTATFATDSTYARDNNGFGWEYRFIKFSLTEETSVTLVAGMTIADSYNPLSWAGVCTPVLYATPIAAAKSNLQSAIEKARVALNAYPIGGKAFQVDENCDAYKALSGEITEAEGVLSSNIIDDLKAAVESLNTAIEGYQSGYVLNAPAEGAAYNIVMDNEGWDYHGKAVTYIANDRNDHGLYNIKYHAAPNANYAQAFTFTAVEGKSNCYTLSMTDVDGNERYVCTGVVYGGNTSQIRTTTDATQALAVKVIATTTDGIHQLYNTEANNYIGSQDAGFFTVNSHTTFRLQEAKKAEVTLTLSKVGWATLILPFDAELPEGVKAWSCGEADGETLELDEVKDGKIKANTPYLMSGNPGSYYFSGYGLADKDSYEDGLFRGTYVDYGTKANSNTYVLQNIGGDAAFYLVGESGQPTVKPYRCYMVYEGAQGAPKFSFGRGEGTTSIENMEPTANSQQPIVFYDLMGRKVTTMEKGGMYIVNGKKVIVK